MSTAPVVTPDIVKSLAPSGTLRATINLGNMVLAQGTPDAPRGITVDISQRTCPAAWRAG